MPDDDILSMFEGLNATQARELRRRIIPALQSIRDEITKKGENPMLDNITPEEMREYAEAFEAAEKRLQARRQMSAEQREAETLRREINDLTDRIAAWQRSPSRFDAELAAAMAELDAKTGRLEEITPKQPAEAYDPVRGGMGIVSNGPGGPRLVG